MEVKMGLKILIAYFLTPGLTVQMVFSNTCNRSIQGILVIMYRRALTTSISQF